MEQKHCNLCNTDKPLIEFYKNGNRGDGLSRYCKICIKEKHVYPHKEKILARVKLYQKNNPEKVKQSKRKDSNKPHNKVMKGISRKIKKYLKSSSLSSRDIIGCSPKELIEYITKQFSTEMNWENRGTVWEIDHIIPSSAFDSTKKSHLEWCWNYKNLRPLLKEKNGSKSDYINNISVRVLKSNGKIEELKLMIGKELERLRITTEQVFLDSFNSQVLYVIV